MARFISEMVYKGQIQIPETDNSFIKDSAEYYFDLFIRPHYDLVGCKVERPSRLNTHDYEKYIFEQDKASILQMVLCETEEMVPSGRCEAWTGPEWKWFLRVVYPEGMPKEITNEIDQSIVQEEANQTSS